MQYTVRKATWEDLPRIEEIYANAHKQIRADPTPAKKSDFDYAAAFKKFAHPKKLTLEQRKERVAAKKAAMAEEDDE